VLNWNQFKERFRKTHIPTGLMTLMRDKFIKLKQGGMSVVEYLDKFNTLSRYAPEDTDTEAKKKHCFLNGLHVEMQSILVAVPYPDLEALVDAAIMVEEKRKTAFENRKRKMLQQQGGTSSSRSRSLPPPRPAPQPQRTPPSAPRPTNTNSNRQPVVPRTGGSNTNPRNNPNTRTQASGCYSCGQPRHFSRDCPNKGNVAPRPTTPRPNQGQARTATGKKPAPNKPINAARGHLNHLSTEEAEQDPDIVLGMFLVNSVPARVLFDSGASHSFVTEPFIRQSGMVPTLMERLMLVQIPGSTAKTRLSYKGVPIVIQGELFEAELLVLGTQGLEVILGMDWMTKYQGIIVCARKAITLTSGEGVEVEYVATGHSSGAYCKKSIAEPTIDQVPIVCEYPDVFP
jgi:hypothetical protein